MNFSYSVSHFFNFFCIWFQKQECLMTADVADLPDPGQPHSLTPGSQNHRLRITSTVFQKSIYLGFFLCFKMGTQVIIIIILC